MFSHSAFFVTQRQKNDWVLDNYHSRMAYKS